MVHARKLQAAPPSAHPLRAHPAHGHPAVHHPATMAATDPPARALGTIRPLASPGAAGAWSIGLLSVRGRGGREAECDGGDGE
jgi:hypothetical protein